MTTRSLSPATAAPSKTFSVVSNTPLAFQSNQTRSQRPLAGVPCTLTRSVAGWPAVKAPMKVTPSSVALSPSAAKPASAVQPVPSRSAPLPVCQAAP